MSLDGFISKFGDDDYSWIVGDPAIDFRAMLAEYDTAVMGRKTWDVARAMGQSGVTGLEAIVFSKSMAPETSKGLRVTNDDPVATVAELKKKPGKDIWLFGGGELFRTLLAAGLVDTVEVAVVPVLLGEGIPLLPGGSTELHFVDHRVLPKSGMLMLAYSVPGGAPASPIKHVKSARKGAKRGAKAASKRAARARAKSSRRATKRR